MGDVSQLNTSQENEKEEQYTTLNDFFHELQKQNNINYTDLINPNPDV